VTRLGAACRALTMAGMVGAGVFGVSAAHAQVPPPPELSTTTTLPPLPTVTTPPVDVTVPGLGIGVHVPGQEIGGSDVPAVPGVPVPSGTLGTAGTLASGTSAGSGGSAGSAGSTGGAGTPGGATSAQGNTPPGAPAGAAAGQPGSASPADGQRSRAAGDAASRGGGDDRGGGQSFGSAIANAVGEPFVLVGALTLALGLGVAFGAAPYLPRYRRRQRELLDQWARASQHERAAAKKLAETDTEKSEFLALVSHELRTPLTAVKGFVDTVLLHWDRLPEERRRELLNRASSNADELGRLVSQLMEFARSDTGPIEIVPVELGVRAAVDSALRSLAPVVADHATEVDVPRELTVEADADAFNHVLVNLLTNAVKFSPAGSRVLVRARAHGDEVVLSVSDEGVGIALEDQERIFDRFYQSSNGDRGRGTGIGLTIAQRFTELHGGRIWVESEPGRGTTFSFTMPAAMGAAVA
jgi:signal transduction histidine kinase